MEKIALIVHGWGGNSNENWLPWLKKKLENQAFETYIPNLPNTEVPILEEQLEYLDVYGSDFINGGYIVGHSLGCQLTMKFVKENNIKNSKIILVAPTYPNLAKELGTKILGENYEYLEKYYDTELYFKKINELNNEIIVFLSDNDPYINMEVAKNYYKDLKNVKFVDFKNKGHFNKSAGVLELEEILLEFS